MDGVVSACSRRQGRAPRRSLLFVALLGLVLLSGCDGARTPSSPPGSAESAPRSSGPSASSSSSPLSTGAAIARDPRDARAVPMIAVSAGTFRRGHHVTPSPVARMDESPAHDVFVSAFRIDATLVTRAAFTRFVEATRYVTTAERLGHGVASREGMDDWAWQRVPGGSFRRPFIEPPDADSASFLRDDAPVVMVSHHDAVAYCAHLGKRLPTEAEWERAMRAGSDTRFPWGDAPERDGGALGLNYWQGESHHRNERLDGWLYVSPVRAFPPNAWGIHDPVGNVWQWVADWYAPDTYAREAKEARVSGAITRDPKGPDTGRTRVLRGGSWWCGVCTCEGYGLHYRGKADPEAPFNNNGFRCARGDGT